MMGSRSRLFELFGMFDVEVFREEGDVNGMKHEFGDDTYIGIHTSP